MQKAKEELLVLAAQQGNEKAFEVLFKHYQPSLLRFAFKLCSEQVIAQEAAQDAWLKISRKLISLKDPRAFKSWLFKAVRWRVYDLMASKLRDSQVLVNESQNDLVEMPLQVAPNTPQESKVDSILELVDELEAIDKQAIYLFYLEEMKITEISIVLEIPEGTVKSRLNRSRNKLREKYHQRNSHL